MEIRVPVQMTARKYETRQNTVGLAPGIFTMLTVDNGRSYGEALGEMQCEYSEWMREQTSSYIRNRADNPGRKSTMPKRTDTKNGFTAISIMS